MKKIYLFIILLSALTMNSIAQENNKPQWFVAGGANSVIALNGSSNTSLGGKISGGVWLNGYTGFRLNVEAANIWMKNDFTATTYGASLDWMANLLRGSINEQNSFSLTGLIGAGVSHYKLDKDYSNQYSKINGISFNFSLQAAFKLSSKLSLFIEPGIRIDPKFYEYEYKDDPYMNASISAGIIYKL